MIMLLKCVAIGGQPATGKTTLVKDIIKKFTYQNFQYGLLRGHFIKEKNLVIMGIYNEEVFCGTDKLSMAVNKDFLKYIKINKRNILFEGDRLFSLNNIKYIKQIYDTKIIILENDEKTLNHRHKERKDSQSDKFLKGRKTKINNISNHFKEIEVYSLQNLNESINLSDKIIKFFQ
jgi:adenylate kinase